MSLEDAEVTAESTALRQDVRDVSVGLTVSLQNTDAECRAVTSAYYWFNGLCSGAVLFDGGGIASLWERVTS